MSHEADGSDYAATLDYVLHSAHEVSLDTAWMYVYCAVLFLSFLATALATWHMRRLGGDIFRSTVRFVITSFLVCTALHSLFGGLFYAVLLSSYNTLVQTIENEVATPSDRNGFSIQVTGDESVYTSATLLDALDDPIQALLLAEDIDDGGESAYLTRLTHDTRPLSASLTVLLLLENLFVVLSAYWIFLLTRELFHLAMATFDRGQKSERKMIRRYCIAAGVIVLLFFCCVIPITVLNGGYNRAYRVFGILQHVASVVAVVYATGALILLKHSGRKNEHVHGTKTASPLYRRLKLLVIVCTIFTLPFSCSQIVLLSMSSYNKFAHCPDYLIGIFTTLFYLFGAVQAFVMGGSQQCCFKLLYPCIPTDIKNSPEWKQRRASRRHAASMSATDNPLLTPPQNPIFVNTDIESSSELWSSLQNEEIVEEAQMLHDDLLRTLLLRHNGYEITTAGDSFQLAFHTVADAVNYCLEAQLKLLHLKWPQKLENLLAATKTEWVLKLKPRLLFKGIRVRMGIHDANQNEEGHFVVQKHPVTGKALYVGASELIGREIGDVGFGGEIIMSRRIAQHIARSKEEIKIPHRVEYFGMHAISQLELDVELYTITPKLLSARRKVFHKRRQGESLKEIRWSSVDGDDGDGIILEDDEDEVMVGLRESGDSSTDGSVVDFKRHASPEIFRDHFAFRKKSVDVV